ncbi:radical SAM domain-containing protein [mine drainage metagenome]|uniref:Radical SAM domain-containing protein n=1 Tax=mine drainage metagenome TaxID=410659 RepID=T1B219_9ZZZZ
MSGGEVTTYPQFDKLIEYLEGIGFPFFLTTNGVISKPLLKKIIENRSLMGVKISIDGLSPESYLIIRDPIQKRKAIYDTVITTLETLKENGVYTEISTLVHAGNITELAKYPKVLASYNIKKWDLSLLLPKGRGSENYETLTKGIEKFAADKTVIEEIVKQAHEYDITVSLGDVKFNSIERPIFECGAGWHFMSIQADLTVFPCPILPYTRFKRLYGFEIHAPEDVRETWDSKPFKLWSDQKENGCPTCKLRDKCGKCAIQADLYGLKNPYENIPACYNTTAGI